MNRRGRWVGGRLLDAGVGVPGVRRRCWGLAGRAHAQAVLAPRAGPADRDRRDRAPVGDRDVARVRDRAARERDRSDGHAVCAGDDAGREARSARLRVPRRRADQPADGRVVRSVDAARVRRRRDREQHLPRHCAAQRSGLAGRSLRAALVRRRRSRLRPGVADVHQEQRLVPHATSTATRRMAGTAARAACCMRAPRAVSRSAAWRSSCAPASTSPRASRISTCRSTRRWVRTSASDA